MSLKLSKGASTVAPCPVPQSSLTFKTVGESDYTLAPRHPGTPVHRYTGTPVTLSVAVVAPPFLLLVVASHSGAVDEVWHQWRPPLHLSLGPPLALLLFPPSISHSIHFCPPSPTKYSALISPRMSLGCHHSDEPQFLSLDLCNAFRLRTSSNANVKTQNMPSHQLLCRNLLF